MTIYKNKRLARTLDNETAGKVLNPLLMVQVFSKIWQKPVPDRIPLFHPYRKARTIQFVRATFTPLEIFVVSVAVGFIQLFLMGFILKNSNARFHEHKHLTQSEKFVIIKNDEIYRN